MKLGTISLHNLVVIIENQLEWINLEDKKTSNKTAAFSNLVCKFNALDLLNFLILPRYHLVLSVQLQETYQRKVKIRFPVVQSKYLIKVTNKDAKTMNLVVVSLLLTLNRY